MGDSIEQYRAAVGSHFVFLKSLEYKKCFKSKFWCTMVLLFYMEAIYLPVLKAAVHRYNVMQMNRLWLTQIYLYRFYIPDLIRLANDVEENPEPTVSNVDSKKTVHGLKRKLDSEIQSGVVKKSKDTETNNFVSTVKNTQFIPSNVLANENSQSNVNTFLFVPCIAKEQSECCWLLNLPSVVNPVNVSLIPQQLGKPSKLYKTIGDGNCLFRAISFSISGRQVYDQIVRNKIVEHMIAIESPLRPHMNSSLDNYLGRSGMIKQNVWGTDIEILTASSLLQTDIYVYTKVGSGYKWQKFSRSMLGEHVPQNKGALYLQNTAGVHYDVVVQVSSYVAADISYTCENSTNKSAINSNEDKQKYTSSCYTSANCKRFKKSLDKTENINSDEIDVSSTNHPYSEQNHYSETLGGACLASRKQNDKQNINTKRLDEKPSKIAKNVNHRPKCDSSQHKDFNCKNPTQQLYSFLFMPCIAEELSVCCSLLNLPSVVNPVNVCQIPQQLGKPSKLYKTKGDGNCLFRAISYSI